MNSRTRLLTAFFVGLCSLSAMAAGGSLAPVNYDQNSRSRWYSYDRSTYFGVRLGLGISQLYVNTQKSPSTNAKAGIRFGVLFGAQLTNDIPLFIEPGVLFSKEGASVTGTLTPYQQKMDIRMNYLEIPVVFKYKAEVGIDDFTIDPFLGGFISLGMGGRTKYFEDSMSPRDKSSTFRNEAFNVFNTGLRVGCGVTYQNFTLELGYNIGLINVANKNMKDFGYDDFDDSVRTGCFNATIGVNF